jgi:hypothetical protein
MYHTAIGLDSKGRDARFNPRKFLLNVRGDYDGTELARKNELTEATFPRSRQITRCHVSELHVLWAQGAR